MGIIAREILASCYYWGTVMDPNQVLTAMLASVPTMITVLIGILINNARLSDLRMDMNARMGDINRRIDDLRAHVDARFDEMRSTWSAELHRVEEVLDARLKHLEER